jgi:hypothetical protein
MNQTTSTYSCNKIYNCCLHLLKATVSACSIIHYEPKDIFILKQSWGRLILWDEAFQDQNLDETMNKSPILKDTALRLFCGIGVTLLKGQLLLLDKNTLPNPSSRLADIIPLVLSRRLDTQDDDLQELADNMGTELKEAMIVTREYYKMASGGVEEDEDWDELVTDRNPPHANNIAVEAISFYVSHLLSLQPTIESLVRFYLYLEEPNVDTYNPTELAYGSGPPHGGITHKRDDNNYEMMDCLEGDSAPTNASSTMHSSPKHQVQNRTKFLEMVPRYVKAVFRDQNELR